MTYHVYVKPDGFADVSEYALHLPIFPGYVYLGEVADKPDLAGKKYVNGAWVWGFGEPEYESKRRKAYPSKDKLIQALWQAMDDGILPKVAGFYDEIADVRKRFPKE